MKVVESNKEALDLIQKCLDDRPYAAIRVIEIMARLERVKEILKEQETKPIEPVEKIVGDTLLWHCGKCGFYIASSDNFCSHCGRKVKRDG